jgi:hypothetical protein
MAGDGGGFMDRLAARAREELASLRRALTEAGDGAARQDLAGGTAGSGAERPGDGGAPHALVPAPGSDVPSDISAGEGLRLRRERPTRWPVAVREAYAALELPLGSPLERVGAAHAELVGRFDPLRFRGLPDAEARLADLRARLDGAEQTLAAWLSGRAAASR